MTRPFPIAYLLLAGLMIAAFAAAAFTQDLGLFSLIPPPTDAMPNPVADTDDPLALGQAAFTAWAVLLLLIPAFAAFVLHGAERLWLAFWSAAWVGYAIHLYVSVFLFFGGDFDWMTNTPRVSAFWPGMVLLVWWPIDILLAFVGAAGRAVRVQRVALHVATFVLFVGGSVVTGELTTVKAIGLALAVFTIGAMLYRFAMRGRVAHG